jgi:hypothetical protein
MLREAGYEAIGPEAAVPTGPAVGNLDVPLKEELARAGMVDVELDALEVARLSQPLTARMFVSQSCANSAGSRPLSRMMSFRLLRMFSAT